MFTGIISDLGAVREITQAGDTRLTFSTAYETEGVAIGASIACSGCCLTVIDKGPGWFAVQASGETLSKTTLGLWTVGSPVNFERALAVGDELGGHIVSGHVDGVAEVLEVAPEGESHRFRFRVPEDLKKFIAPKGSVAIDGVSLTVNEVEGAVFGVNIIPHTFQATTFGRLAPGSRVNMEIDMLARYVARLLHPDD
ncbi:riboflavin synthase [Rhodospirillum rubrum]|uniref:Riboflavin synthase n=1 Tax=Rhodospirillum rubrum (strain ATCC 11170 / ATH 1.1.1 / DSM 467 / LMG 4362 / NCIMB 8255 / S1) TaxID=269796 RepID=Q2RTC1_RHORT|nr:riboflavin synthase [Rhodospirillum rubrum]ABC22624.1 Lumazine-binding protein [Rhodospirillum rubrum ATCC 11170]AEO48342.1 riboflavin synthase subunit alpha [Rhodospirillum rubrum F11]QXG82247.1 riboflavin synthase [Rhodospirillum rubrum]HCF17890.1 riboflavin synthase [Rhodospirillum rubrum]